MASIRAGLAVYEAAKGQMREANAVKAQQAYDAFAGQIAIVTESDLARAHEKVAEILRLGS
jgi:hypothetical protein